MLLGEDHAVLYSVREFSLIFKNTLDHELPATMTVLMRDRRFVSCSCCVIHGNLLIVFIRSKHLGRNY